MLRRFARETAELGLLAEGALKRSRKINRAYGRGRAQTIKAQVPGDPGVAWAWCLERATGIEPALSAWEAEVLPLNYARVVEPCVVDRRTPL